MHSMEEECNISLALAIGRGAATNGGCHQPRKAPVPFDILFPKEEKEDQEEEEEDVKQYRIGMWRSKSIDEEEAVCVKDKSESCGGSARKKLRLTTEQVTLLEDSFRDQNTLNQTQKQELAERLNIQPRQVEVWFQNRRARTKLKQTEVDCEYLKKFCDSLMDENRRLKEELQKLRSLPIASPFYLQLPKAAATLTMCPSCERIAAKRKSTSNALNMKGLLVSLSKKSVVSL